MPQKQRRKTRTCEYLSQAFWEIYSRKPINQITVRELTEKAGVHRSSFYGHFEDIYDFLDWEEEQLLKGIEGYLSCQAMLESNLSALEEIIQYYRRNLPRLSLLCGEHGDPGFSLRLRERIVPEVMRYLQIPPNAKDAYYILDFIVNGMLSFLTTWYRREGSMPPDETMVSIRDALANGGKLALIRHSSDPQMVERFLTLGTRPNRT